jgi:serpin B
MMNVLDTFGHARIDDLQILELPYVGDNVSMVILLPDGSEGIKRLEERLTSEALSKWLRSIRQALVLAYVPKFRGSITYNLSPVLASMGMTDASSPAANFSGMATEPNIPNTYISGVVHKAYVDVYEKGSEAAAATAVIGATLAKGDEKPQYETFNADHPFIYLIRDRHSGRILFLGRMMNPAS